MEKLATGQLAPVFRLAGLDGQVVDLGNLRGQVVVLNFWSAECGYVARTDRELLSLVDRPDWRGKITLLTIASNSGETQADVATAAGEHNLPCVLLDSDQKVADLYHAQTTPHVFVIDAQGRLRYQGALNDFSFRKHEPTRFYAREALEALFNGSPIPQEESTPYGCAIVRSQS